MVFAYFLLLTFLNSHRSARVFPSRGGSKVTILSELEARINQESAADIAANTAANTNAAAMAPLPHVPKHLMMQDIRGKNAIVKFNVMIWLKVKYLFSSSFKSS